MIREVDEQELEKLVELTEDHPTSTFAYSVDNTSIEDFDRHIECWGNTHVLANKNKRHIDSSRVIYEFEFRCGRTFQTEYKRLSLEGKNIQSKPDNACPGCCPSMDEISKW